MTKTPAKKHDGKVVSVTGDKLTTTCGGGKQHLSHDGHGFGECRRYFRGQHPQPKVADGKQDTVILFEDPCNSNEK
jgi:hypothetical protein